MRQQVTVQDHGPRVIVQRGPDGEGRVGSDSVKVIACFPQKPGPDVLLQLKGDDVLMINVSAQIQGELIDIVELQHLERDGGVKQQVVDDVVGSTLSLPHLDDAAISIEIGGVKRGALTLSNLRLVESRQIIEISRFRRKGQW